MHPRRFFLSLLLISTMSAEADYIEAYDADMATLEEKSINDRLLTVEQEVLRLQGQHNAYARHMNLNNDLIIEVNSRINHLEDEISKLLGTIEELNKKIDDISDSKNGNTVTLQHESLISKAQDDIKTNKDQDLYRNDLSEEIIGQEESEDYDQAFSLLEAGQIEEAEKLLYNFINNRPSSKIIPYASYWLGEISYAKSDFYSASNHYLRGYKSDPRGRKAIENAFKLGMSLKFSDRKDGACITFKAILKDFAKIPISMANKINKEISELKQQGAC